MSDQDVLPFYVPGTLLPPGSIPEPDEIVTISFEPASLYTVVKDICDMYHLGFRLYRNGDKSQLFFDVYTGDDRTTLQSVNTAVVFSQELDNLSETKELTSVANLKEGAYVYGKFGYAIVYPDMVEPTSVVGLDRRMLVVKADDIDLPAGPELQAALTQRGKEELAKHRAIIAFDGSIPQKGSYQYLVDYDLGDLVEMRNADGMATNMRVTEQIFIDDQEGERSYPTLTIDTLITPGSWYAWSAGEVWADADEFWEDV